MTIKETADKAHEIAKTYGSGNARVAAEHGLALACKGLSKSFKDDVRAELNRRGYRI